MTASTPSLAHALALSGTPVVAVVGGGGKTSAVFRLARDLAPAVVTTTTHLGPWEAGLADRHVLWAEDASWPGQLPPDPVILVTAPPEAGLARLSGLPRPAFSRLLELARRVGRAVLVEADGSRQRPLKAPAAHEPAIPSQADLVLVVAGLAGLFEPLDDRHVHRPELFAQLSGLRPGNLVTADALAQVLAHPEGGLRNVPPGARRAVLLNQATTRHRLVAATGIARQLLAEFEAVVIGDVHHGLRADGLTPPPTGPCPTVDPPDQVRADILEVHVPVAGIVLAAGAGRRYGAPKQLLADHGTPLVRRVTETALAAGLSPVHVVVGAHAAEVAGALDGLPVTLVHNPRWADGQSTSVRAGIGSLPERTGAAIFLLADQPRVPVALISALRETHARGRPAIVAPAIGGTRSSPMLFDRSLFGALAELTGDIGGRALLDRHGVVTVPWPDPAVAIDVDTPEDYERLLQG